MMFGVLVLIQSHPTLNEKKTTTQCGMRNTDDLADVSSSSPTAATPTAVEPGTLPSGLSYTVECYENERWFPIVGWTMKRLPTDRQHFSTKDGKQSVDPTAWPLPAGYAWVGDWGIDKEHPKGNDADGWRYAVDYPMLYHSQQSARTFVRRRRWIRTMIRLPNASASSGTGAPNGVALVSNESFDCCSVPCSVVGGKRMARKEVQQVAVAHRQEDEARAAPILPSPLPPQVEKGYSCAEHVAVIPPPLASTQAADADDDDLLSSQPVSESTRYFIRKKQEAEKMFSADGNASFDDADELYAAAYSSVNGVPVDHEHCSTKALSSSRPPERSIEEIEEYNFHKTISEIVEDVDRTTEATAGFSYPASIPIVSFHGSDQRGEEDCAAEEEDAFNSVFQHFVSSAKIEN